jgi:aminoglycoside phosphotransferase (APT) family kinase protein
MHKTIERVATNLRAKRSYLTAHTGVAVLHGDVHSGNTAIRPAAGGPRAVLLDWGQASIGSPLEDVSSWLQSLSYWEPRVKRRHDTLLTRYFGCAGRGSRLDPELRKLYWLAAASNAMVGAPRYHLAIMADPSRTDWARGRSAQAALRLDANSQASG